MRKYLFLFLLASCSPILDENHFQIANQAKPFVDKFYSFASNKGMELNKNLIVQFSDLLTSDGVLGKTFYGNINVVKLDNSLLESMTYDPLFFETVLYHELGHALLNRLHCYDCYSLMNPNKYVSDYRQDQIKREVLLNELFKK